MMDGSSFDRLQRLSCELTGNNTLLPVAAAAVGLGQENAVSAPRINTYLAGRVPHNRIGHALVRLNRLGVVHELPYVGRPHARLYEIAPGPFWVFIEDWALNAEVDLVDR
jgi:hypothetical protein